ncbi:glycoside hydrolase family 32 protein [Lewinella sp. W8]|uniref:glycoside hydrolase family 32 protein n=1 Tax=Lewinella sp. W8 TaxID=2528208 RepID=UPI0010672A65|nr:glycoside hydrolase family 32 protein [Lewinella sp. W8]MTB52337.1 glycoside hydrolase family 32 protein [Lewinella sp. W8]
MHYPRLFSTFAVLSLILTACTDDASPIANDSEMATATELPADDNYRPVYHFTPPANWMNDPNGMVYHRGEYHLFYQYYPDSNVWGPMHWGHAVTENLVDWEHLPVALAPDSLGYIFSGSAVIDHQNTSGFGSKENPPMVAIFTHHDPVGADAGAVDFQYQSIAYSVDQGRTWTKYDGNPVIPNPGIRDFRDPKVIWDEAREQWLMVFAAKDRVQFWTSPNLLEWEQVFEFGQDAPNHDGVWECPDFFPLPIEGTDRTAWVLIVSINPGGANGGSGTFYFVGDWDGETFTPLSEPPYSTDEVVRWLDYGRDNYAGVTWSDIPEEDGRRIFLGWMSNWDYAQVVPTTTWRSAMTIPRSLHLQTTDFGTRLRQRPVSELKQLRGTPIDIPGEKLAAGVHELPLSDLPEAGVFEMELLFDLVDSQAEQVYVTLSNESGDFVRLGYDRGRDKNEFFTDRRRSGKVGFEERFATELHRAPRWSNEGQLRLHVFFDRTSLEFFADQGEPVMTDIFFPESPFTKGVLEVYGDGHMRLEGGKIWPIAGK